MMESILEEGRNVWRQAGMEAGGLLVDARDYYRALYRAAEQAERYILLAGWQFDSDVRLLRGQDAENARLPVEFLPLLRELCRRRPALTVHILAWDFSLVYALEREWMQKWLFDWSTEAQIHFEFDGAHPVGASHHQKLAIFDGRAAYVGGIDVCASRWDRRSHAARDPERDDGQSGPYHDVQAYCTGPVVQLLDDLFRERWRHATGRVLELPAAVAASTRTLPVTLPLGADRVAISRTRGHYVARDGSEVAGITEIQRLYEDAIAAANRLIYIENQYFTSEAVHDALVARFRDRRRPRLSVVLVMPRRPSSAKEEIALGEAQVRVLGSLESAAAAHGHVFRVYETAHLDDAGVQVPTYIHSKLLVVDDELLLVGSANLTNRSMGLDSELALVWQAPGADSSLSRNIRRARADLLAEHAGTDDIASLEPIEHLVERLDQRARTSGPLSLHRTPAGDAAASGALLTLEQLAFDPSRPLADLELDDLVSADQSSLFARGIALLRARKPSPDRER
jgi:phosphatidylserine/phosphatidylglycerophosphate/cardiolipin synthase-like enzyme